MAISGMTGFGRADGAEGAWTWAVEARSVNGRSLEVRFRGPQGFEALDRAAREAAQSRFQRGQFNLTLQAKRAEAASAARVNLEALDRYLELADRLVRDGRAVTATADGLLALRGVVETADETDDPDARAAVEAAMAASIAAALDRLKASREAEGAGLAPLLAGLVDQVESLVARAQIEAAGQPAVLKERLARKIAELISDRAGLEERIVQEAAVLAGKADVREELDRLVHHIGAARGLLEGAGPSGRKLDFLTQEFMREANTLCAKSATSALTSIGLEMKAAIDQFREQVQNVE